MADQTGSTNKLNAVLPTMGLTTSAKEYALSGRVRGRKVNFYCDVAWKYSDLTAGTYLDVPAHPQGLEITVNGDESIFAKVASGTGTLSAMVTG